jgi:hypothetical protein
MLTTQCYFVALHLLETYFASLRWYRYPIDELLDEDIEIVGARCLVDFMAVACVVFIDEMLWELHLK